MNGRFSNVKKVLAALVGAFMLIQCAALGVCAAAVSPEAVVYVIPEVVSVDANQIGRNYIYVDVLTENTDNDHPVIVYLTDANGEVVSLAYGGVDILTSVAEVAVGVKDSVPTGDYTVTVALYQAEDIVQTEITYASVEDVEGLIAALNGTDVDEVSALVAAHYEALSAVVSTKDIKVTGDSYIALSEEGRAEFAKLIANGVNGKYSSGKGLYGAENSEAFVKEAYVVAAFNAGGLSDLELSELLYGYSETIGFDANDENLYGKIESKDTFLKIVKTMVTVVDNIDELMKIVQQAACVQIVNEADWLNRVNVIVANSDSFNINKTQLNKVNSTKSWETAFCTKLKEGVPYYSVNEICEAWDEIYDEVRAEMSSSSSGGGGGGGTITTNKVSTQITSSENNYDPNVAILDYYTDVANTSYSWTSEAVLNLTKAGIVSGYGDKTFAPANSLTRAEFTKMLINTMGLADITATCSFADVDKDAWYYIYVASAEKYGLAQGYGNGLFGVNDSITRQDAVTLIYRAAQAKGLSVAHFYKSASNLKDKDSIAAYAYNAVEGLYNAGVYLDATDPTSVNVFEPTRNASRGYVAVILNQLYIYMK